MATSVDQNNTMKFLYLQYLIFTSCSPSYKPVQLVIKAAAKA